MIQMSNGRMRLEWTQTSALLSQMHNINRGKGRASTPDDFNPTVATDSEKSAKRDNREVITNMGDLKHMFVKVDAK